MSCTRIRLPEFPVETTGKLSPRAAWQISGVNCVLGDLDFSLAVQPQCECESSQIQLLWRIISDASDT